MPWVALVLEAYVALGWRRLLEADERRWIADGIARVWPSLGRRLPI